MRRHGQNPGEEDAVFLAERVEARCGSRARWKGLSNRWLSIENVDARRLSDPDDLALFLFFPTYFEHTLRGQILPLSG
jgi:hypothetical protein